MKKIVLLLLIATSVQMSSAQGWGASVSGGYLSEIAAFGASADIIYDINEKFGISTNGTYSVADEKGLRMKWFAWDLNGRYKVIDEFYLLAGGEYLSTTLKGLGLGGGSITGESKLTENDFGLNLGSGYKYRLVDNVSLFAEAKYVIVNSGYFHARMGVQFDF